MSTSWKPWDEFDWDEAWLTMQAEVLSPEWLYRPRDEFDVGVHPESLRGKILALRDETDDAWRRVRVAIAALPWYRRWPIKALARLRGIRL